MFKHFNVEGHSQPFIMTKTIRAFSCHYCRVILNWQGQLGALAVITWALVLLWLHYWSKLCYNHLYNNWLVDILEWYFFTNTYVGSINCASIDKNSYGMYVFLLYTECIVTKSYDLHTCKHCLMIYHQSLSKIQTSVLIKPSHATQMPPDYLAMTHFMITVSM